MLVLWREENRRKTFGARTRTSNNVNPYICLQVREPNPGHVDGTVKRSHRCAIPAPSNHGNTSKPPRQNQLAHTCPATSVNIRIYKETFLSCKKPYSFQEFEGNVDGNTVKFNTVPYPNKTSQVLLFPTQWHKNIALRFELYGCEPGKIFYHISKAEGRANYPLTINRKRERVV